MRTAAIFLLLASCAAHTEPRTSISLAVDDAAIVPSVEAAAAEWRQCGLEVPCMSGRRRAMTSRSSTGSRFRAMRSEAASHSIRYVSHDGSGGVRARARPRVRARSCAARRDDAGNQLKRQGR